MSDLTFAVAGENDGRSLVGCYIYGKPVDHSSASWNSTQFFTNDEEEAAGDENFDLDPGSTEYSELSLSKYEGIVFVGLDVSYHYKQVTIDGFGFNLKIKDIDHMNWMIVKASDETEFLSSRNFFNIESVDALILVISVFQPNPIHYVTEDLRKIRLYISPNVPILLVGNRTHPSRHMSRSVNKTTGNRKTKKQYLITPKKGDSLAREINAVKYLECSTVTGRGVRNVFYEAVWATNRPSTDLSDEYTFKTTELAN